MASKMKKKKFDDAYLGIGSSWPKIRTLTNAKKNESLQPVPAARTAVTTFHLG